MKKYSSLIFSLVISLAFFAVAFAGSLSPSTSPVAEGHTLNDIYNLLANNATSTPGSHYLSTTTSGIATTSNSISEIYANLANLIPQENLKTNAHYLGVTGNYGVPSGDSPVNAIYSSLTPNGSLVSTGYSLGDLFNLIHSSVKVSAGSHLLTTTSSVGGTMSTIDEIYNALTSFVSTLSPDDIKIGYKYLGVTGNYSPVNYGLTFDGTNYVVSSSSPSLSITGNSITVSSWVYPISLGSLKVIVGNHMGSNYPGSWGEYIDTSGKLTFNINHGGTWNTITGNTVLNLNAWSYVVSTYDGSNVKLYVNGVLETTTPISGAITQVGDPHVVIGATDDYGFPFSGKIGEVSLFSSALTASDIFTLYAGGTGLRVSPAIAPGNNGLVGLWQFDENTGITAYDSSGNGNSGILVNSPTYIAIPTYLNQMALTTGLIVYYPLDSDTNDHSGSSNINATRHGATADAGKINGGYLFNGSSDYVNVNGSDYIISNSAIPFGAGPFTVSTWVNANTLSSNYRRVITADGDYLILRLNSSNNWEIYYNDRVTGWNPSVAASLDAWTMLTLSKDENGILKFYKDGSLVDSNPGATGDLSQRTVSIGASSGENFSGSIDEVGIWNRALSPSDVQSLWNNGSGRSLLP